MAPKKRVVSTKPIDDLAKEAIEAIAYKKAAEPVEGDGQPERAAKKWSAGMARHFRERFAERLKSLREEAGLSVRALADKAGVDHSQLVRLEAGERSCTLETAVNIAGALGVSLGLLTDEARRS